MVTTKDLSNMSNTRQETSHTLLADTARKFVPPPLRIIHTEAEAESPDQRLATHVVPAVTTTGPCDECDNGTPHPGSDRVTEVNGVMCNHLLHPRSFSVVRVSDLRKSPNSNLQHSFRFTKISESEFEESESLLNKEFKFTNSNNNSSLPELFKDFPIQPCPPEIKQESPSGQELNDFYVDWKPTILLPSDRDEDLPVQRRRKLSVPDEIPTRKSAEVPSRPLAVPSSDDSSVLCNRKLSSAATQFPRVKLEPRESLPIHYKTVNPTASKPYLNVNSSHYLTIQPPRSRGYPAKDLLDSLQCNFVTNNIDGNKSIDFGSTDGRNIRFIGKAVLTLDPIYR